MARATHPTSRSDAVTLLKRDHAAVQRLFKKFEDADETEQEEIARKVCGLLTVHAQIEEEIFYPAAREALDGEDELIDEAEVEHNSAKELIARIESMRPGDPRFAATVKVLGEYVEHHVEEEQDEIFPKVKRAGMDLEQVGAELQSRRQELMSKLGLTDEGAEEEEEEQRPAARGRKAAASERRPSNRSGAHHSRASGRSGNARRARAR